MVNTKLNRTSKSYFLWPKPNIIRGVASIYRLTAVREIEELLQSMFPTGYPVLCSSGRSAITLALEESGVTRGNLVGVFPYASHCVLDAISRVTTPLAGPTATKASLRVVYHQWGYVQETNLNKNSIEDCVDTLCIPGTTLFPGGGNFEIWSFPKILGTTSGGVLWCKDEDTAIKIRAFRNNKKSGLFQWILRLLSYKVKNIYYYWAANECEVGSVSRFQAGEIIMAIKKWNSFVVERRKNLDKIWPFAIECLSKPVYRLPSVVPVSFSASEKDLYQWGVVSGFITFEKIEGKVARKLITVLPVPIHQDVTGSWLNEMIENIKSPKTEIL